MASGVSGRAPVSPGAEPLVRGTACQKVGGHVPPVHPMATPLSVRPSVTASVVTDQAHTHTHMLRASSSSICMNRDVIHTFLIAAAADCISIRCDV